MRQLSTTLEGKLATATRDNFNSFKAGWEKMNFSDLADELKLAGKNITAQELAAMKPTKELFHELVAVAARNGDQSASHEVTLAAKATRNIYDHLGNEANNQNLFLNLHNQAERAAVKQAMSGSPASKILATATEDHLGKVIEKQAAQLVRLKDQLFALKQAGLEQSKNGLRIADAIQKSEASLSAKGADSVVKKLHQEFADKLKAATANVTDVKVRNQIARDLWKEKQKLAADAALTKKAAKENLAKYAEQQGKDARLKSEQLQPTTAASYLPRMWDIEKIMANEQEFSR